LHQAKFPAEHIAARYRLPSGLSIGAQANCLSGSLTPYFSGTPRSDLSASSQTW
jgi:hypothetical protein